MVPYCKSDDEIAMGTGGGIRRQDHPAIWHPSEGLNGALDVAGTCDWAWDKFDCKRRHRGVGCPQKIFVWSGMGVSQESGASQVRRNFLEHGEPLAGDPFLVQQQARDIATRSCQACDQP